MVPSRHAPPLVAPPADPTKRTPIEQALRLVTGLGDELETSLATTLGATRARELRVADNGWPGLRMDSSGCPK